MWKTPGRRPTEALVVHWGKRRLLPQYGGVELTGVQEGGSERGF